MNKKHIGSNFDDFLREENLLEKTEALAKKRVPKMKWQKRVRKTSKRLKLQTASQTKKSA